MSGRFVIDFDPAEGAVVRLLGLLERRGFCLRGLTMRESSDRASITVEVEPRDSGRSLEVMARQLGRLVDVQHVSFSTTNSGPIA